MLGRDILLSKKTFALLCMHLVLGVLHGAHKLAHMLTGHHSCIMQQQTSSNEIQHTCIRSYASLSFEGCILSSCLISFHPGLKAALLVVVKTSPCTAHLLFDRLLALGRQPKTERVEGSRLAPRAHLRGGSSS